MERLQKILSARGLCSRRAAEAMIKAGRITCNGMVCQLGDSADPDTDVILVDGKALPSVQEHVYIMLHKPRGYVTTLSDEKGRKNAAQLVADCAKRVYPVGRLDMDSEGLLLFTNDGSFADRLMHPKHQVDKTYRVSVEGFTPQRLKRLQQPMTLDGYQLKLPQVTVMSVRDQRAQLEIVIHEGRNRQVRRMCAMADMQVRRLVRVGEGPVTLGQLPLGKWRYLTEEEIRLLGEQK